MAQINQFEKQVIDQVLKQNNVSMNFVRSRDTSKLWIVAARNGIIAFLYDQGWDEDEIAAELHQELLYVQIVIKHHNVAQLRKKLNRNKRC